MIDLHQGFTGRELKLSAYAKLTLQQLSVFGRLLSGKVAEAGSLQLATLRELAGQLRSDAADAVRALLRQAEERLLEALKPSSRQSSKPNLSAQPEWQPSPAGQAEPRPQPWTASPPGHPAAGRNAPSPAEIAARTVQEKLKNGEALLLVDVREPVETLGGVIPGALLIPLSDVLDRIGELRIETGIIVFYCASGNRSRAAAQRLIDSGLTEVASLRGGMRSWAQNGADICPPHKNSDRS